MGSSPTQATRSVTDIHFTGAWTDALSINQHFSNTPRADGGDAVHSGMNVHDKSTRIHSPLLIINGKLPTTRGRSSHPVRIRRKACPCHVSP